MTIEQQNEFKKLTKKQERAKFLLNIGVSAKVSIIGLDVVSQAFVGDISLPIHADNDSDAIANGIKWLQEIAAS